MIFPRCSCRRIYSRISILPYQHVFPTFLSPTGASGDRRFRSWGLEGSRVNQEDDEEEAPKTDLEDVSLRLASKARDKSWSSAEISASMRKMQGNVGKCGRQDRRMGEAKEIWNGRWRFCVTWLDWQGEGGVKEIGVTSFMDNQLRPSDTKYLHDFGLKVKVRSQNLKT